MLFLLVLSFHWLKGPIPWLFNVFLYDLFFIMKETHFKNNVDGNTPKNLDYAETATIGVF